MADDVWNKMWEAWDKFQLELGMDAEQILNDKEDEIIASWNDLMMQEFPIFETVDSIKSLLAIFDCVLDHGTAKVKDIINYWYDNSGIEVFIDD